MNAHNVCCRGDSNEHPQCNVFMEKYGNLICSAVYVRIETHSSDEKHTTKQQLLLLFDTFSPLNVICNCMEKLKLSCFTFQKINPCYSCISCEIRVLMIHMHS